MNRIFFYLYKKAFAEKHNILRHFVKIKKCTWISKCTTNVGKTIVMLSLSSKK